MQHCNPIDTSIAKGEGFSLDMCPKTVEEKNEMSKVPYSSAIESLMYATICTRPDIYFAIGLISGYQSNPRRKY